MLTYHRHENLTLKTTQEFNEAWLHEKIIGDASILGLGEVRVMDHERRQIGGGRLDLLLYDEEENRRYEVEIMLGPTDPSHIVRTIEYWDIERRRYPGYEHVAVLIAENITSRFLNVLSLMSGSIPFIAIQLSALRVNDLIVLDFVRVLDQTELRLDDTAVVSGGGEADRKYWEEKAGASVMTICDELLREINQFVKVKREMNFLKHYIGLRSNGVVDNFVSFNPKRKLVHVWFKTYIASELHASFEQAGLPSKLDGQKHVRVSLTSEALSNNRSRLEDAIKKTVVENDL
jgi:hypothetical protein